nr:hypothetical protein [Tanacetum cinerariifolium]
MFTPTFAKTHNLIAYLEKPIESEGFAQIIDFLNGSSVKYALTASPAIYTSCIKQFWTSTKVKTVNDEVRIQALFDGKRVNITESSIRRTLRLDNAEGTSCLTNIEIFEGLAKIGDVLRLDDAEGVDCLPNEEIFAELARMADKEEEKKEEEEDDPVEVQEVVDVVTTAKLIIEVVTAASETVTAARTTISTAEPQVPAVAITTAAPVMKKRPQTEAQARKNMIMYLKNVAGFRLDYFKGMSYDDIRPIFETKFNLNIAFLLKTKKQLEEEENRAIPSINETLAQKAAKRRKLNEEVEDLKKHLEIVPDEDDDVYTEATPLARKVPVVDYEIIHLSNKPHYKIIRADGTHQL